MVFMWILLVYHRGNTIDFKARDYNFNNITTRNLLTLRPEGNVGIGTSNPNKSLHIYESSGTVASSYNGTIILQHGNSGGASSIVFKSAVNHGNDYGYIQYQDSSSLGGGGESAKLILGTQNDADDDIILKPSGNVGIGTTNPHDKLEVNGSNTIIKPTDTIGGGGLYFAHVSNSRTWDLRMGATVRNLHFDCYQGGWGTYMTLLTNGHVGIERLIQVIN